MESIAPSRATRRPDVAPLVTGTVVGTLLVVGGIVLAFLAFGTPLLTRFMPGGRPGPEQMAAGMALWALALVAPAACILLGANRLAAMFARVRGHAPRQSTLMRAMGAMPEDVVMASGLTLADGRTVSDLVMGPFGAAVIRELPPAAVTRVRDGSWELRTSRGWIPLENPLDRAVRDAERVRRWLAHDDADFVVKVYAAVVGPAPTVARTTACAVLTPEQLPAWVKGLPAQRSLTPGRRDQMVDRAREAAASS
ncbi:MAG TPA: hypothetical protein VD763_11170 [Candidatus Saccharimonadales bacterium]|nr:hypothetical protein [Candidatus Saccharimonadales bacterium]